MSWENLKQEAISSSTSSERLREIAAISNELAGLVASNPHADSQLLDELAIQARNNRDSETQRAITLNPNTSTKWLIALAHIFPEEFFANPAYNLLILEEVNFKHLFTRKQLLKLACIFNTPTSFLDFVAAICQTNIQTIKNDEYYPHLSLENQYQNRIKNKLGYPFNYFWKWREILIAIASHKNTSRDKLKELSIFDESIISEIATLNRCYISLVSFIQKKINSIFFKSHVDSIFRKYYIARNQYYIYAPTDYSFSNLEYYGLILAKHPETSSEILAELTQHIITEVRVLVASHPNVSQNSLFNLLSDRDSEVRKAALANPKLDSTFKQEFLSLENKNLFFRRITRISL